MLKSASRAASDGDKPIARIVNWGIVGLEPAIMAYGPVPASKLALERAGMSVDEIDLMGNQRSLRWSSSGLYEGIGNFA